MSRTRKRNDTYANVAEIFKALADPTRLKILFRLAPGELCVSDLCAGLTMSQPTVSHHLSTLRAARLVQTRRKGREIFYSLTDQHVLQVIDAALEHSGE